MSKNKSKRKKMLDVRNVRQTNWNHVWLNRSCPIAR